MHFKYYQTHLFTFSTFHFPIKQRQEETKKPNISVTVSGGRHRMVSSYLLEMATASPHEHHWMTSVSVRGHGRHTVSAVVKQRSALNDPQSSERLVQNQATEIITNLLGLQDETRNNEV